MGYTCARDQENGGRKLGSSWWLRDSELGQEGRAVIGDW